jgi:two-component system nitrate/nitrite sensor histidine kinase NarX
VDTQDEFGQVASGFNRMAAELQTLYTGLEAQVEAKTCHIEAQRARLCPARSPGDEGRRGGRALAG